MAFPSLPWTSYLSRCEWLGLGTWTELGGTINPALLLAIVAVFETQVHLQFVMIYNYIIMIFIYIHIVYNLYIFIMTGAIHLYEIMQCIQILHINMFGYFLNNHGFGMHLNVSICSRDLLVAKIKQKHHNFCFDQESSGVNCLKNWCQ